MAGCRRSWPGRRSTSYRSHNSLARLFRPPGGTAAADPYLPTSRTSPWHVPLYFGPPPSADGEARHVSARANGARITARGPKPLRCPQVTMAVAELTCLIPSGRCG